jgi:4-amino-4-deoxy-L-arabinose transferase-like glycosyltransferase
MPEAEGSGPEPRRDQPARVRLALGLLLTLSLGLNAWGIGWGLPSAAGWAPDELLPSAVLDAMSRGFTGGWHDKYPPLHYYVLATLYLPVLKAAGLQAGMPVPPEVYHRLLLIGRGLSLLMAAGTLWLVYRCGRELGDARAGLFAAAIAALFAPFAFYAKLANLDVPYLFWWVLSLLFLLKALSGRGWRNLLLFAATATLAVTTKDQAYGLYALTAPVLLLARVRARGETGPRAAQSFLAEAWRAAAVACVLFAIIHNIPGNPEGFRAHLALITGRASKDFQEFANDAGGQARLLASTVRHVVFVLGLPAFLAGALGLVEAFRERANRWLLLLVPAASFYLSFLCVVLYVYDRFALPIAIVLAFFAGRTLSRHWGDGRWPRTAARAGAVVILAYGLTQVVGVDLSMTYDARYAAEDWLKAHVRVGSVGAIGPPEYLPRLDGLNGRAIGPAIARLEKVAPDFVTVNADYAARAEEGSGEHALYQGLANGTLGYREVWRHRYRGPWPLLDTAPLVERTGHEPLRSNLGKVNPEILIYRRTDDPAEAR